MKGALTFKAWMRMRTEFVMSIMGFSLSDLERVLFLRACLLQFVGTRFVDGLFLRCVKLGGGAFAVFIPQREELWSSDS